MRRASEQDGTYPRPQLLRGAWADLSGEWEFAFDDADAGLEAGWHLGRTELAERIVVPFPPESPASGIGDTGFHRVVWYRRVIRPEEVRSAGFGETAPIVAVHFGAVDFRASVWAKLSSWSLRV